MVRWRAHRVLLWRVAQWLLTLVPTALVALAGAMYLWRVKLAVEESLPPALREYARRQAELDVQLERVLLSWDGILLANPEVRTLTGERLLSARTIWLRPPRDGEPLTVELHRPEVWLQRDRRGVWNIEPLLRPPRPPEPTPFSLRVIARRGTLYFDDFLPNSPVRATAWIEELTYSQPSLGGYLSAHGASDALGKLEVHALSDGTRWLIDARASQVDGTRLKPYLPATEFDLQRAEGQVALQLTYAPDQPLRLQGTAQGVATNPTFRQRALPWRKARFALVFTESALAGAVQSADGRLAAQLQLDWKRSPLSFEGQAKVVGDAAALWRLVRQDKPLAQGKFEATLRFTGTPEQPKLVGAASLERIDTPQGAITRLRSPLIFTDGQLYLPELQAEYAGHMVRGKLWMDIRPQTPQFRLYAHMPDLPLHRIPALRETPLQGKATLSLIAYGAVDNPQIEANFLCGSLVYNRQPLGSVRARVRYHNGTLDVPIAILQGSVGAIQLSGTVSALESDDPRLELTLDADELDLNLVASLLGYANGAPLQNSEGEPLRVDGIGYFTAQARGSLRAPQAVMEAVVFDGRLGDIGAEVAIANLNLVERELRITELQILRRAAQLWASGVVQLPERADQPPRFRLQGNLYELDLATIPDWLRRELPLAGVASGAFEATGTPQQFVVDANLSAETIQYDRTLLRGTRVEVVAQFQNGQVQIQVPSAQAQLEGGQLEAQGSWRSDGVFEARWQLHDASLAVLTPYLPVEYRVAGQLTLAGQATGTPEAPAVDTQFTIRQAQLNDAPLGELEGTLSLRPPETPPREPLTAGTLHAQLALRPPQGELQLAQLEYDLATQSLHLEASTDAVPIEWLRQVVRAVPDALPPTVAERIETLQGQISAQLRVEGALSQPRAELSLNAETLEWRAQPLGTLALQATWQGVSDAPPNAPPAEQVAATLRRLRTQRAEIAQLRWQADTARLNARLAYTPEAVSADLEAAQLPLRWARLWNPSLPEFDGLLDVSLIGQGSPESPELQLSATVSDLRIADYTIDQLLFSAIEVREGVIQTDDALIRVGDYQARLSGRVPFHWSPLGIPDDEPILVQARLREQPLTLLGLLAPIDPERTQGTIDALLEIGGTLASPEPRGRLQVQADQLAWQGLNTALEALGVEVVFDGREARIVQAQARSSEGGTVQVEGSVEFASEQPTVNLRVLAAAFTANEPKLPVLGTGGRAVVSGAAQITGDWRKPLAQGAFVVQRGFLYLPPELPAREAGEPLPLDPRFEVRVQLADDFVLRNPNLDARLEGAMEVGGSLSAPTLVGEFSLRGGVFNLPTARLRIEPDSVARLSYPAASATGETIARVELDVRATTSVVASDFTGEPTRYRVEVSIRGALDDPERLNLTARSEPPGLSEQTILTLLGRGQALAALARGVDPAQVLREQIGDILTAQVLPQLFLPLETGIAEALDLEQFTLDYTGLRPASLYVVKNLFDGVGIAYRRSIGVAANEYQVRLFYRLPFRNRLLQRLRIGVGFDHTQTRFVFLEGSLLFR